MQFDATAVVDFRVAPSRGIKDRKNDRDTGVLLVIFNKTFKTAKASWVGHPYETWVLVEQ